MMKGLLVLGAIASGSISLAGSRAFAADEWIDALAYLQASCAAPRAVQVYTGSLPIPAEVEFLLGNKGALTHESVQIEGTRFGSHSPTSIAATSGGITLASGFLNGKLSIRLVIDETYFCVKNPEIVFTYTLSDTQGTKLPGLRVRLLSNPTTQDLSLTAPGLSRAIEKIDEKYGRDFKFFIDDKFSWVDAYLDPKNNPREYCLHCYGGRMRQRMVMALARFFDHVDPMLIVAHDEERPLSTWSGAIHIEGAYNMSVDGVLETNWSVLVKLEFSGDDVLSFVDEGGDGVQIKEITQNGIAAKIEDE